MLLSISTTHQPATDVGFLLHKNPANVRTVTLATGPAHVFYPEATAERCTAVVMVEVDPVGLVRRGRTPSRGESFALAHYVNDRPYVASSFMSVALAKLFGTAMSGQSADRPELAQQALPLTVEIPVLPCRGGEPVLRRIFEPLGYGVEVEPIPLDPQVPEWGPSCYVSATFTIEARVADVLNHFYVLLPVLDDAKHYWVGTDEVEKLVDRGKTWLAEHPDRELIVGRYLRHRRRLTSTALDRLVDLEQPLDGGPEDTAPDDADEPDGGDVVQDEAVIEERVSLNTQRIGAVVAALQASGAKRILDLGCGEGRLVKTLLAQPGITEVVGVDVSYRALELAARQLRLDEMPERQRQRVQLLQSALTYRDRRLVGFDAATLVEVIEHVDADRLPDLERVVFGAIQPRTVVVTTPNAEHNVRFEFLPIGTFRHRDHRFEWTRAEFGAWVDQVAEQHGYTARLVPIGTDDPEVGPPTQMAVFTR